MNIVLTGPMGSGKSTVGKRIAQMQKFDFIDTDDLIEKDAGCSISEIFEQEGESGFRRREALIAQQVALLDNHVISTGGGIVLSNDNLRHLRTNGSLVYLSGSIDTLYSHVQDSSKRPLLQGKDPRDQLKSIVEARLERYTLFDSMVSIDGKSQNQIASEIVQKLTSIRGKICVSLNASNFISLKESLHEAVEKGAQVVEFRLDYLNTLQSISHLQDVLIESPVPVIATIRRTEDGGQSNLSEEERVDYLIKAITAGVNFVDIEFNMDTDLRLKVIHAAQNNNCKVIVSYHEFDGTPELETLEYYLTQMKSIGDIGKIVPRAVTVEDCKTIYTLLERAQEEQFPLISFCMGTEGVESRIKARSNGSMLTYACLSDPVAPGQLSIDDLHTLLEEEQQ